MTGVSDEATRSSIYRIFPVVGVTHNLILLIRGQVMNFNNKLLLCAVVGVSSLLYSQESAAQSTVRSFQWSATAACNATTILNFSGYGDEFAMERRATGYLNTNSNNALRSNDVKVVCNTNGDILSYKKGGGTIAELQIFARNTKTNRSVDFPCIMHAGYVGAANAITRTRTVSLPTSGALKALVFSEAAYASFYPTPITIVCDVPAGVEMNDTIVIYQDN